MAGALSHFLKILGPEDVARALQKAREIIPSNHPTVMWHGSGSGDLRGGISGLHLGTHEAAQQAIEARIGVPAEGWWNGLRKYGDTMLMGKDRIPHRENGYPYVTGYNVSAPAHDYLPQTMPKVSGNVSIDPSWSPSILPFRITGEMKNTPQNPLSDMKANATMQGLLKREQVRRGLYYRNEGEDYGSISATVPGPGHVEPVDLEQVLRFGKFTAGGRASLFGDAAPAINMLTAQLLRDGWDAPRLRFLKEVPRQGFAPGGPLSGAALRRAIAIARSGRPAGYFEVAPGETWNKPLQQAWETLRDTDKRRITDRAISEHMVPWQKATGISGDVVGGLGGYKGFTNPSKIFYPDNPEHLAPALNEIGEMFAQDAMMGVARAPFAGSSPTGIVTVKFPENVEPDRIHDVYQRLMRRGLTEGHSTDVGSGVMSMLAGNGGRDTKRIARGIDRELGRAYPVWAERAHVSFPENRDDYGLYRNVAPGGSPGLRLGSGSSSQIIDTEARKSAARDSVRSLVEEALGAPLGAEKIGRAGGGRMSVAIDLAKRLGRMLPEGSGYLGVPGKPSSVAMPGFGRVETRPIPEIEQAAAAYNRSRGLPSHEIDRFVPTNPEFSGKVAREFDRMAHNPSDPLVRRAYDAMIEDTLAQYRAAKDTGIDFRFLKPGQADPYAASPALGYEDILNKGRLFVFPTDQGFGTLNASAADNPLLRRVGRIGDKHDAVANDAFRIVHDLYGHYGPGNPFFRAPGEERAFQLHSKMFSPEALPAATSETRGQNSWVNYGPPGEFNRKANAADTIYADQKIGLMPSWAGALPPEAGADVEGYIRNLIRNGRARGGALIQDRHPTHYLPGVGRQVMADGGATPSMANLMANVNSVFSRSSPAADASSLIGVSSQPYRSGEAYTDAGGQKIAAPFVTGMRGGYPIPPQAQQASSPTQSWLTPSKRNGSIDDILSRLRGSGFLGFKSGGSIARAIKNYVDPASKFISDWKWRPLSEVSKDVGTNVVPPHVQNFGRYMADISDKAATEGLDPEDAIKAYMITRSSIQREGRAPEKLASQGALIRETDEPLVRPEGQMAEFLRTPHGIQFLNEARKGNLSQDVVDAAMRVMKPFGMSKAEPDAMDWSRRNLPSLTPWISDMVRRARVGESTPEEWRDFTQGVRGVGPAKTGFIASLLGRGDLPTLDARQAILHTGMKNADVQDIMGKRAGRVGHEAVDRLAARQRAMGFQLPKELDPFYQHLAHHTVWDAVGNEKTTHQDIIDAMRPRAAGGRAGFAGGGWRQFADIVDKAVNAAKGVSAKERFGVYHNLDTENIGNLVKRFNGIPAPSLAISKPLGNPAEEFGKATLVGRPHLAIPTEDNHVFGADAYTPRFPSTYVGSNFNAPDQADRIAKEYIDSWGGDHEGALKAAQQVFGGSSSTPLGEHVIHYLKNPGLLRGGEYMFMPNGDTRGYPVTAENVIAYMKAHPSILGGEGETGIGLLKAHITPRPTSLEDIQKRRYSIVDDLEEPDNDWNGVRRRFNEMHGLYRPYARDDSVYPRDQFTNALIDLHHEGVPGFMKTYRDDIPRERIGAAKSLLHDTKELMPTYMEAKPLRNVGFDEFGAAVLPFDETGRSASRSLMDAGMPEKSIQFYSEPHHRFRAFRNLAEEHGFAGGGPVERAVDVARSRLAGGGLPGERAHEFVQSQLYDEPRESPLVEQYAEPMTRYALDRNADRPMPTAHEFVRHQLGKEEPQLPQFDRAARDKMRDYAVDVIHGAGYFTPLAPALAAYDVAHGISTGDPLEMGMSILGAPGKYGKAAALAASILGTQEAQAGPYSKFIREVAERVRPHYDPLAMIKGMPRKEWISDVALSRPLHEMTARTKDFRQLLPYNRLDPEDVSGSALITGMGDRTPAGYVTTHLNEKKLRRAIDNMGGPDFPRDEPAQLEGAYWGSNFKRARAIANKGVAAAREGFEPLFMYVNQGPQSQDFSHMMTDAILGQMKPSRIDKTMASEFDRLMREVEIKKGTAGISTWPGITNPKLRKWLIESKEGGAGRAKMAKLMDKVRYRDAPGFADVGAARWATTNPELMHTPNFSSGYMISRMDPQGRLITDPKIPHPSYDTLLAAPRGQQGYMGGFEYPIPPEIHFHDYFSGNSIPSRFSNSEPFVPAIKESNRDKPFEKQTMSLMREIPTVIASPKWVDMASEYQDVMRSLYGRR